MPRNRIDLERRRAAAATDDATIEGFAFNTLTEREIVIAADYCNLACWVVYTLPSRDPRRIAAIDALRVARDAALGVSVVRA